MCARFLTMAETGSRKSLSSLLPIALLCFSLFVLFPPASSSLFWFLGSCYCEDSSAPICFQHMGPTLLLPKFLYLPFIAGWKVRQKIAEGFNQSLLNLRTVMMQSVDLSYIHLLRFSTEKLSSHTHLYEFKENIESTEDRPKGN